MATSASPRRTWMDQLMLCTTRAIRSHSSRNCYKSGAEVATYFHVIPLTQSCQSASTRTFLVRLERAHVVCSLSLPGLDRISIICFFLSCLSNCCYYHIYCFPDYHLNVISATFLAFPLHLLYLAFPSPHQPPLQDLALIVYRE